MTIQKRIQILANLRQHLAELKKMEAAHKQMIEALQESEEYFRVITLNSADIIFILNKQGTITYVSPSLESFTGYKPEELIGTSGFNYIQPADSSKAIYDFGKAMLAKEGVTPYSFRVMHKDGSEHILEGVGANLFNNPIVAGFVINVRDMTERNHTEEKLQASEILYRRLFEAAQDGILILDPKTGQIDKVNPYLVNMLHRSYDDLLGKKFWEISPFKDTLFSQSYFQELQNKGYIHYKDIPLETKEGKQFAVEFVSNVFAVNSKKVIQCNIRNVTDRKQMEEEFRTLSVTDQLTGLYNRRGFITVAEQQLKITERTGNRLLMLFADVDNLKWINDNFGHLKGDEALIETANIFKRVFRESDVIARIGGDEFAVLAFGPPKEYSDTSINRLQQQINKHKNRENRSYDLSISIGIAAKGAENRLSLEELMAQADAKMYEHKKSKQL
jgi:diguanylate cyclase (GGDEF)-like protein/PAS domain S-box-containing protein